MKKDSLEYRDENRLLRINDVVKLTTLSKSCIHLWVAQGRFPAAITLSPTVKVWRLKDLVQWIENQSPQDSLNANGVYFQSFGVAA
jgi:predicted DNA-binding transcriptional regulator AlpA